MRLKKGTEVEVMEKGELIFESWRPAKIVKGNGHTYVIKYDNCGEDINLIVNKVPRKLLRPRPPPIEPRSYSSGDIVEVFENYSWRLAEILRILCTSIIVVRLLGSSKEIEVPLFLMRVPSTWKNDCWTTYQRESDKHKNSTINNQSKGGNLSSQIPPSCLEVLKCDGDDLIREKYDTGAYTSGRSKKRPRTFLTPTVARASKKKRTTTGKGRGSDDESKTSSVASCSFYNGSNRSVVHKVSQKKEFHGLFDDAESFSSTPKVPLMINHNLEFDSYYSTMMSLYESGSLNWEQELLLTNLRLDLHISNDEHLSTIRRLLSARR